MIKKAKGLLVLLVILMATRIYAQDPQFSQFYAAPLYLNPALAGVETNLMLNVNYRSQWKSIDIPANLSQFSFIFPIVSNVSTRKHLGGVGVSAFNETTGVQGSLTSIGAFASGAYNLDLDLSGLNRIILGLQGGFVQKNIDFNNLQWGSQYDEFAGFQVNAPDPAFVSQLEGQRTYPLFNAGLLWFLNPNKILTGSNAFAGISASNLNQPNESLVVNELYRLPILYKIQGGMEAYVTPKFSVSPSALFLLQGGRQQFNIGTYFGYKIVNLGENPAFMQLGVWHRVNDSFIISAGMASKNFTVGFSYDYNSSSLRFDTRGRGAYEFSISYKLSNSKELKDFSTPLI